MVVLHGALTSSKQDSNSNKFCALRTRRNTIDIIRTHPRPHTLTNDVLVVWLEKQILRMGPRLPGPQDDRLPLERGQLATYKTLIVQLSETGPHSSAILVDIQTTARLNREAIL